MMRTRAAITALLLLAGTALAGEAAAMGIIPKPVDHPRSVSTPAPVAGIGIVGVCAVAAGLYVVRRMRRGRD